MTAHAAAGADIGPRMVPLAGLDYLGEDALVVHLAGRLGPAALLRLLRDLRLNRTWVILDLSHVPELDPPTLAVLAKTQRRLQHQGAHLALWQPRAQPRHLIEERRFNRIVEVVDGDLHAWLARRPAPPKRQARMRARTRYDGAGADGHSRDGAIGEWAPGIGPPPEAARGENGRTLP